MLFPQARCPRLDRSRGYVLRGLSQGTSDRPTVLCLAALSVTPGTRLGYPTIPHVSSPAGNCRPSGRPYPPASPMSNPPPCCAACCPSRGCENRRRSAMPEDPQLQRGGYPWQHEAVKPAAAGLYSGVLACTRKSTRGDAVDYEHCRTQAPREAWAIRTVLDGQQVSVWGGGANDAPTRSPWRRSKPDLAQRGDYRICRPVVQQGHTSCGP